MTPFCSEGEFNWVTPAPGKYLVEVEASDVGTFNSGKGFISARFRFLDGPDKDGQFSEQMILWKAAAFGKALGHPKIQDENGKWGYEVEPADLVGRKFQVETILDEFKGVIRCKIVPGGVRLADEGITAGPKKDDSVVPPSSDTPF